MNPSPSQSESSILIVDDCTINLRLLSGILNKKGYRVLQAENGSFAISCARENRPDLILLDIMMPGMSGYEVCRRLKADELTRDIPVIFISALNDTLDRERAFSVGAVDYITKPFQIEDVLFRIKTHLTVSSLHRKLAERNARLHREVSERKRAQEALQKSHKELEKRVRERTASLAEANARLEAEIIERKQLLAVIEKSKAELAAIYDAAPVVMLLIGEDRRIRKANHFAKEIAGCSFQDIVGLYGGQLFKCINAVEKPENCGRFPNCIKCNLKNAVQNTLRTGEAFRRIEIKIESQRKAGKTDIWMLLSTVPLQISGERNVLVCLQDITDHKKTDELLKKSHDELEKRVEQRTLALKKSEKQLKKAMKAAEAANAVKGKFLANMSHEIRTPLNAILGFTYLILKTGPTVRQSNYLEKIRASSHSLLEIINEILDFSKIEAGKLEVMNRPFRMKVILDDITDMFQYQAAQKAVSLNISAEADVPHILFGDPLRIKQVLMNLVGNAVKFTKDGKVSVRVTQVENTDDCVVLCCAVEDTGIGIPEAQLKDIFSPFTQVDDSETREYQGTGLGLAISSQLVGLMGGNIRVESEPGSGSLFSVVLPFEKRDENKQAAIEPDEKDSSGTGIFLEGRKILLVEDNEINRELMLHLLEHEGADADIAENGHKAVVSAGSTFYDAILMDLQLPGMNGYEAAEKIRRNESASGRKETGTQRDVRTPIIGLTAHAMKGTREKCLAAGMDDYISKPIEPDRFFSVLNRWIGKPHRGSSARKRSQDQPGNRPAQGMIHALDNALAGVDVHSALERISGSTPLLLALLKKLVNFSGSFEIIKKSLDTGNTEEAQTQIHALKGVAGNLSAVNIYQSALNLENLLKEKEASADMEPSLLIKAMLQLQEDLEMLQNALAQLEASDPQLFSIQTPLPEAVSRVKLKSQLTDLYSDLKMYKTSSEERFASVRPHLPEQEAGREIERLEMQIDAYDFEGAQETLASIASIMNISL